VKVFALVLALAVAAACGSRDQPEVKRDPERQKRVIEPPTGKVRPLPPHAIRGDGVGPFRLGASLAELSDQLPGGPRIATFDIPNVVHRSLLRAEDDTILIGGEPLGKATFVAVVGGDVARTESGLHVGSTRDELVRALGTPLELLDRARDPRVVVPSGMRNARVVVEGDRVAAIVVIAEDRVTERSAEGCTRPAGDDKRFGACMLPAGELIAVDGDEITLRAADTDKPIGTPLRISGLRFAAPLRNAEGRDELVAISRTDDAQQLTWTLVAFRFEGARLVRVVEPTPVYQLSAASARWIGAELRDLDLYLELTSHSDSIEVGGLLTTKSGDRIKDIVVISPVPVLRHRVRTAPAEPLDAGTNDGAR
jgi:hypothetical protein